MATRWIPYLILDKCSEDENPTYASVTRRVFCSESHAGSFSDGRPPLSIGMIVYIDYDKFCLLFVCNFLKTLVCLSDAGCKLDLGFVVDTTKSIKKANIPKLKRTLNSLVQQFDVSEDGTHVSLETFASESTLHNKFNDSKYHSKEAFFTLVRKSIGKLTMPTRLDKAIHMAVKEMFTNANGDRQGVLSVMVLLTDGKSHPDTDVAQYMKDIKDMKVR